MATKNVCPQFDLNALVAWCFEVFDKIGIDLAQKVNAEFAQKRAQFKKPKLKFRASGGPRRALGWVPFQSRKLLAKMEIPLPSWESAFVFLMANIISRTGKAL